MNMLKIGTTLNTIYNNDDLTIDEYSTISNKVSFGDLSSKLIFNDETLDNIWNQMYVKSRKVIEFCGACGSGNAISNSNCCQCGAPASWFEKR